MYLRVYGYENLFCNKINNLICKNSDKYTIISQNNKEKCGYIFNEYFTEEYSEYNYHNALVSLYGILNSNDNNCFDIGKNNFNVDYRNRGRLNNNCLTNNILSGNINSTCNLKMVKNNDNLILKNKKAIFMKSKLKKEKVYASHIILILHGWGANSSLYKNVASCMSSFGLVLVPDFLGFGKSEEPKKVMTIDDYAENICKLLELFEFDKLTIFCHSFGARVFFSFLKRSETDDRYYTVLSKLGKVIFTGAAGLKQRPNLLKYLRIKRYKYLKKKCKNNPKYMQKLLKYGSNDYKNLNNDIMKETFVNAVNSVYPASIIKKVSVRTLIIHGKSDREVPLYLANKLHKIIKSSKLEIMKGAGHFAFLDDSIAFNNLLFSFMAL